MKPKNLMRLTILFLSAEWLYIISGTGRATAFAGSSSSRTFDFQVRVSREMVCPIPNALSFYY